MLSWRKKAWLWNLLLAVLIITSQYREPETAEVIVMPWQALCVTIIVFNLQSSESLRWPAGTYGIPKPVSGCPRAGGFRWRTGWRLQDTNYYDDRNKSNNSRSTEFHIDGKVTKIIVNRSFCIKDTTTDDWNRPTWPQGKYCIYRRNEHCPEGLSSGWVFWNDDEFDFNDKDGTLPDGSYVHFTEIKFCCRTDGNKNDPIYLPTESPFFLLAYESAKCQMVKWAIPSLEWIYYFTTDWNNDDQRNGSYPYNAGKMHPTIYYCYYQGCNKTLTAVSGTFQSPNYPRNYPDGQYCSWRIIVNTTQQIHLVFSSFSLQKERFTDEVYVYDGDDTTGGLLEVFYGGHPPPKEGIYSSSSRMFVIFKSDKTGSYTGFNASYHAGKKPGCNETLTAVNGTFQTPNYPRNYPDGQYCSWRITVNTAQQIHVVFSSFRLQNEINTDAVYVYDGENATGEVLGVFYGGDPLPKEGICFSSNRIFVLFKSDNEGSYHGFRASYYGVNTSVPSVKTASSHIPEVSPSVTVTTTTTKVSGKMLPSVLTSTTSKALKATVTTTTQIQGVTSSLTLTTTTVKASKIMPLSTTHAPEATSLSSVSSTNPGARTHSHPTTAEIKTTPKGEPWTPTTKGPQRKGCNETLTAVNGTFQSPNYPRNYPDGQYCSWRITVNTAQQIHLVFSSFRLQNEKDTDAVYVYDGENATGEVLGMFYGGHPPPKEGICFSSNRIFVIFKSDNEGSYHGFRASYYGVNKSEPCTITTSPQTNAEKSTSGPPKEGGKKDDSKQPQKKGFNVVPVVVPVVSAVFIATLVAAGICYCKRKKCKRLPGQDDAIYISFPLVFTKHFKHNLDINFNAELNIVDELTNASTKQQQQTFMNLRPVVNKPI
ncbi:hypothetical protein ACROYT_G042727 [Oculina patagonica]